MHFWGLWGLAIVMHSPFAPRHAHPTPNSTPTHMGTYFFLFFFGRLQGGVAGSVGAAALAEAERALESSLALRPHHRPARETLNFVKAKRAKLSA